VRIIHETGETKADHIIDGVKIFIHRVEPTEAERRRADALWREIIALLLNDRGDETGRITRY
jgi:hypothetical protein